MNSEETKKIQTMIQNNLEMVKENATLLRNIMINQSTRLSKPEEILFYKYLGNYGTEEDFEMHLYTKFLDRFQDFLSNFLIEFCADDTRLHEAMWILGDSKYEAIQDDLETLDEKYKPLSDSLRRYFFTFNDIERLHDRAIQKILRETDYQALVEALCYAEDKIIDKFCQSFSHRAEFDLRENIKSKKNEISREISVSAQQNIISTIFRLYENGEIIICEN